MNHPFSIAGERRRSKYGNRITEVDGIKFDSAREAKRYSELKLLERAGEISFLQTQVPFPLVVNDMLVAIYRADFSYICMKSGSRIVEDSKGFRTPEYRLKAKLMKAVHGIDILET